VQGAKPNGVEINADIGIMLPEHHAEVNELGIKGLGGSAMSARTPPSPTQSTKRRGYACAIRR